MTDGAPEPRSSSEAGTLWRLAELEGPLRFLRTPGPWLWIVFAIGVTVRVYLVTFTQGTDDVRIWFSHAGWTREYGLLGYYEWQEVFNHPPLIGKLMSLLWVFARQVGLSFSILLRAPFALLDLGNALLLFWLFRDSRYRFSIFACYWLHPLSMIYSAYHGNTDTGVAFFCLLALSAAARGSAVAAGVALGMGLWVKLPVVLAGPALLFFFDGWRRRLGFAAAALLVGASTYLPIAIQAPDLLYQRVLAYPGLRIETAGGIPIWTIWSLFGIADALPAAWRLQLQSAIEAHAAHNTLICLLPILVFAWLRRGEKTARALGVTVCGCFVIFYGFNNNFLSFQYFAWSIPFWFFPRALFPALATLAVGGYVYGAYALFCGNPFLLGEWNFRGHPLWPGWLLFWRDASVLLCFASAWAFLGTAAHREWLRTRARAEE